MNAFYVDEVLTKRQTDRRLYNKQTGDICELKAENIYYCWRSTERIKTRKRLKYKHCLIRARQNNAHFRHTKRQTDVTRQLYTFENFSECKWITSERGSLFSIQTRSLGRRRPLSISDWHSESCWQFSFYNYHITTVCPFVALSKAYLLNIYTCLVLSKLTVRVEIFR